MSRIVHIADLHFGDEDEALVADFLDQLPALAPDVVVVAGDLTQTGSKREFAAAAAFLGAIDVPVVLTPGNHDTPLLNIAARLTRPWRRLQTALEWVSMPGFRGDGLQVESFNSARGAQFRLDWSLGVVSQARLERPLQALATSDADTRVLTAHHPILSPLAQKGRARTRRAARFAQPIAEAADLVLTGHLHIPFACPVETSRGRSWFVGASTAFSGRTREEPAGFNLLTAAPGSFRLTPFKAEARRFVRHDAQTLPRA